MQVKEGICAASPYLFLTGPVWRRNFRLITAHANIGLLGMSGEPFSGDGREQ
ncbi:MAG: hypothetical protein ACLR9W_00525 [Enterobacter hormaechei]